MEIKKYRVISPLDMGAHRMDIGAEVTLDDAMAKDLLGHTVVPADRVLDDGHHGQNADAAGDQAEKLSQQQLQADRNNLQHALADLERRESALKDGEAVLMAERDTLASAQAALNAGKSELEAGRAELASALAKLEADRAALDKAGKAKK